MSVPVESINSNDYISNLVDILLRQSDMSRTEAISRLERSNYDIHIVLNEWYNISINPTPVKSTGSQERYRLMREHLKDLKELK